MSLQELKIRKSMPLICHELRVYSFCVLYYSIRAVLVQNLFYNIYKDLTFS